MIPERMMAKIEKISSLTEEKSQPAITNQIAEIQVACRAESLRRGLGIVEEGLEKIKKFGARHPIAEVLSLMPSRSDLRRRDLHERSVMQ